MVLYTLIFDLNALIFYTLSWAIIFYRGSKALDKHVNSCVLTTFVLYKESLTRPANFFVSFPVLVRRLSRLKMFGLLKITTRSSSSDSCLRMSFSTRVRLRRTSWCSRGTCCRIPRSTFVSLPPTGLE